MRVSSATANLTKAASTIRSSLGRTPVVSRSRTTSGRDNWRFLNGCMDWTPLGFGLVSKKNTHMPFSWSNLVRLGVYAKPRTVSSIGGDRSREGFQLGAASTLIFQRSINLRAGSNYLSCSRPSFFGHSPLEEGWAQHVD